MAKKKKKQQAETEQKEQEAPASSAAAATASPSSTSAAGARIERAFELGNFSQVRELTAAHPEAKDSADKVMPRIVVDKQQVMVALAGLLVVLIAMVLTLRGPG